MSEGRWCGGLEASAPGRSTEREKAGDGGSCMTAWDGAGETRVRLKRTRAVGWSSRGAAVRRRLSAVFLGNLLSGLPASRRGGQG
jgi:hypothetical protein